VVVTRAAEQAQELVRELESLGAEVLPLPTIAFREAEDSAALDEALRGVSQFDWILFTSRNAVKFFAKRCRALGLDPSKLQSDGPRIATVGPATAKAAREEGFRVYWIASWFRGEALARELREDVAGKEVLLPRSDRAADELPAALRAAGAAVRDVVAYRTVAPDASDGDALARIRNGEADVIAFASPSAFHHFVDLAGADKLPDLAQRVKFAAIGPTTAGAIRETGLAVQIEAEEATSAGLARAIANYFEQGAGVKSR
jgi:uroporphyrinogen III methyltransferase/synthase